MAKRVTTLFIGDTGINITTFDGLAVDKWSTSPLEAGLVEQGLIANEEQVAQTVREAFRLAEIGGGKVVAGLSGASSLYRMITLPEMPEALFAEAVRREARRVLPIDLDEVYLSYQPVQSVSRGERRLFLTTYPRNATDAMIRTLRLAGLNPYLMDLAPLAVSRVPDEERALIIGSQGGQAEIIVVEERIPQLIRVLSLPAEATTLEDRLPAIAEELTRTVMFYNSSHAEKPITPTVPLFVYGEVAQSEDMWPQLVGRLAYPTSTIPLPVQGPPEFPANDFMVNIGLGLKELEAERSGTNFSTINLNVLPNVYQPKRIPVSRVLVPAVAVVAVGVLAYMGSFVVSARSNTANLRTQVANSVPPITQQTQQIASLKKQVDAVPGQFPAIDAQVAAAQAVANTYTSTLSGLKSSRTTIDTDLKSKIIGLLPYNKDSLSLASVSDDGSSISLTGAASDQNQVIAYARALMNAGGISSVVISTITVTDSGCTFSLSIN